MRVVSDVLSLECFCDVGCAASWSYLSLPDLVGPMVWDARGTLGVLTQLQSMARSLSPVGDELQHPLPVFILASQTRRWNAPLQQGIAVVGVLPLCRRRKDIIHMAVDRRRDKYRRKKAIPQQQEDKKTRTRSQRQYGNKERDSTQGARATGVAVGHSMYYNPRSRHAGLVGRLT